MMYQPRWKWTLTAIVILLLISILTRCSRFWPWLKGRPSGTITISLRPWPPCCCTCDWLWLACDWLCARWDWLWLPCAWPWASCDRPRPLLLVFLLVLKLLLVILIGWDDGG